MKIPGAVARLQPATLTGVVDVDSFHSVGECRTVRNEHQESVPSAPIRRRADCGHIPAAIRRNSSFRITVERSSAYAEDRSVLKRSFVTACSTDSRRPVAPPRPPLACAHGRLRDALVTARDHRAERGERAPTGPSEVRDDPPRDVTAPRRPLGPVGGREESNVTTPSPGGCPGSAHTPAAVRVQGRTWAGPSIFAAAAMVAPPSARVLPRKQRVFSGLVTEEAVTLDCAWTKGNRRLHVGAPHGGRPATSGDPLRNSVRSQRTLRFTRPSEMSTRPAWGTPLSRPARGGAEHDLPLRASARTMTTTTAQGHPCNEPLTAAVR